MVERWCIWLLLGRLDVVLVQVRIAEQNDQFVGSGIGDSVSRPYGAVVTYKARPAIPPRGCSWGNVDVVDSVHRMARRQQNRWYTASDEKESQLCESSSSESTLDGGQLPSIH